MQIVLVFLFQGNVPASLGRFTTVFTPEMEEELANLCRDFDARFYGITRKRLMQVVYQFAEINGLSSRFNTEKKMAGKDFVKGFCRRHKLSFKTPEQCSLGRAIGFNEIQVNRFFENLRVVYQNHNFLPHQIFNMDETGISTVPNKTPKVISPVGKKGVCKVSSGERGQLVSVAACFSASGRYIPPAIIFARKRMKLELYNDAPIGSLPLISDSGYMNNETFLEWLRHFANYTQPSADNKVLLILDNHSSHISLASINFCRNNHITMLSLPPHASHKIQPLDKGFFGPLKTAYSVEVEKWLVNNPGRCVTQPNVCALLAAAYNRVSTVDKAVKSFQATGIYPYNPDVFTAEDFAPSKVTDRSLQADQPEKDTDKTPVIDEAMQLSDQNLARPNQSKAKDDQQPGPARQPTSAETVEQVNKLLKSTKTCSSSAHIDQLKTILPLPICKGDKKPTKSQKSEIVSGSPFKKIIEEKLAKKEQEEKEKEAKRKARQENKLMKDQPAKKKLSFAKKKLRVRPQTTLKLPEVEVHNEDNETFCAGCGESFDDKWVECNNCLLWWHEDCSGYIGTGPYLCDHC